MILAEPPPGQGDIHFRIFGIPVRVHPFFWLIAVLLVIRGDPKPAQVLIWVAAMFVSILIHELGHAWLQRRYGGRPRIVLYGMGGLAISEYDDRSITGGERGLLRQRNRRISWEFHHIRSLGCQAIVRRTASPRQRCFNAAHEDCRSAGQRSIGLGGRGCGWLDRSGTTRVGRCH